MRLLARYFNNLFRFTTLLLLGVSALPAQAWQVVAHEPAFSKNDVSVDYQPLKEASKAWKICALYPHLKDAYWLSVNYGMVEQSRQLGVELKVLDANGYNNEVQQLAQVRQCRKWGADAILLGAVSPDMPEVIGDTAGHIPLFGTINAVHETEKLHHRLAGRVGVDWYYMGREVGDFLVKKQNQAGHPLTIAVLAGPKAVGGTFPVMAGLNDTIKGKPIKIVTEQWDDNSKELQRNLLQEIIEKHPNVDYIIGSAVAIEVGINTLRSAGKLDDIGLVSTYFSHGVYRGLRRNRIDFAPSDQMVLQGRLSVDQAVRYLEDKNPVLDLSTRIVGMTPAYLPQTIVENSLSPARFRPVFISTTENSQ
ncbi:TMAO reductase system periplasmic protein TorT [Parasalinivibrio latis]|uniref:TMAO reductase system periplasmic protein TorT n=1 Tax=Parasalinivibrio latis TaxID=2952610 RepID=UPI0030E47C32